jgi:hypothetical protein
MPDDPQTTGYDEEGVGDAVESGRVIWRAHALQRMLLRGVTRDDVKGILLGGEVIERYDEDSPFPSALILGTVADRRLHVVAAWDGVGRQVYVISAYEPDEQRFEPNGRTRRRKS